MLDELLPRQTNKLTNVKNVQRQADKLTAQKYVQQFLPAGDIGDADMLDELFVRDDGDLDAGTGVDNNKHLQTGK